MSTKHTEGMWHAQPEQATHGQNECVVTDAAVIVARIPSDLSDAEDVAKLIAAAPELLEAAANLLSAKDRTNQSLRDALRRAVLKAGGDIYSKS